jgi:hypothetical protein
LIKQKLQKPLSMKTKIVNSLAFVFIFILFTSVNEQQILQEFQAKGVLFF